MITLIDSENCIFENEGDNKMYRLPITISEIRNELATGYIEKLVHPYFSELTPKEASDVEDEEITDYIFDRISEWEEVHE